MVALVDSAKKKDSEIVVATVMARKSNSCQLPVLIVFALLSFFFVQSAFAQVFSPEVKKVAEDFVCQCGCNHQPYACGMVNCGSAIPLQKEIQGYLEQAKSRQEIRDIFVSKYSKLILSAPTTQGFDLTAWTMPF